MKWPEAVILASAGKKIALAPFVISASRATDIPAFHMPWFMSRLRAGYCQWQNPFNSRQQSYISFEKCAVIVFWSKNPQELVPYLCEISDRGYQFYIQFTLNDYEHEGLEPNIPPLAQRIATFQDISSRIGPERIIWRFDPIIIGEALTAEIILARFHKLAEQLAPFTEKLVFSFLDMYRKIKSRLKRHDSGFRSPTRDEMIRLASGIASINRELKTPLRLSSCAETLDMQHLGVEAGRCIDPELLLRLCPENSDIQQICSGVHLRKQERSFTFGKQTEIKFMKDRGQRAACGCAPSKDIGSYSTCCHFCAYCYANASEVVVNKRLNTKETDRECL